LRRHPFSSSTARCSTAPTRSSTKTLGAFTTELASEQHEEATAALAIQAALADVRFREVQLAVYDSSGTLVASSHAVSTVGSAVHHPVDLVDLGTELGRRGVAAGELFTVGSGDLAYRIAAEPGNDLRQAISRGIGVSAARQSRDDAGRGRRLHDCHPLADC
jgi:hypothetical protein